MEKPVPPPPGSPEARAIGCQCPIADNEDMAGSGRRVISGGCPVHWPLVKDQSVNGNNEVPQEILADLEMSHIACETPEGPHQPIAQQVEVVDLLPCWMFAGGWADGPFVHHPGARLFLDYAIEGRIYYQGYQRLGIIGWFREDQMEKVRPLPEGSAKA